MSVDHFLCGFFLFGLSAGFLWLVGVAAFADEIRTESLFRAPWLGCGIVVGVLQILHMFLPITWETSFILLATLLTLAVLRLVLCRHETRLNRGDIGPLIIRAAPLLMVSLLAFVPVFNCCTKDVFHYDLGLYYLKTIRWIESFPVVPGLVNLQPHLGFNQSAFLLTSVFDSLVPDRRGIFLVGGLLPWLGLSLSSLSIVRMVIGQFSKESTVQPIEVAYAISLPAWAFLLLSGYTSSASPDSISFCLVLHLFLVFSCFVASHDSAERSLNLGEILFIGATCLCINPNSLAFVGGVVMVCGGILYLGQERLRALANRRLVLMTALSAVILTTWTGRGVVLSGYPFFPSSAVGLSVPWRMPVKRVDAFRGMMVAWARDPDPNKKIKTTLRTWRWLSSWRERLHFAIDRWVWSTQVGIAGSVALASAAAMGRLRTNLKHLLLLSAPLLLHSTFWFLTVPQPKYFLLAAWLFALCPALTFINRGLQAGVASSMVNLCLNAFPLFLVISEFRWAWCKPGILPTHLQVVETKTVTNSHGVQLWVPLNGEQTFDSPIPSAQGPVPDLAFLDPQKGPAGGFKFQKATPPPERIPGDDVPKLNLHPSL